MALFGMLLAFSAPGFNLWILAWIALIPALLWVGRQASWKPTVLGSFLFGFFFQGVYCLWFFDLHPLTWLGFSEWGSRLTTLAGWLLIAVEGGLITAFVLTTYFCGKRLWFLLPMLWIFGFSLLYTTPLALPWGLLEYTQASLPVMRRLAVWLGASGLTFILIFHNAVWAQYFAGKQKPNFGILLTPLLIWVFAFFPIKKVNSFPLPVAAVQANLPIEIIRSGRLTLRAIDAAYLEPLRRADLSKGTLVAYPEEGVVPGLVSNSEPLQNEAMRELHVMARQKQVYIAVGVTVQDALNQFYNSIALISPEQNRIQFYHKRKLVPFGEFTPYGFGRPLQQLLAQWQVDYHAPFSSGRNADTLQVGNIPVGGLVCFELIDANPLTGGFSGDYKRRGVKLLLNTSNLGWFHENPLMEAQFLAIGQLRAAENQLPLLIASNTGISAVISPEGSVLTRTNPFSRKHPQTQLIAYPPFR
jgi:apolipoprotein N-acyltransferase